MARHWLRSALALQMNTGEDGIGRRRHTDTEDGEARERERKREREPAALTLTHSALAAGRAISFVRDFFWGGTELREQLLEYTHAPRSEI